MISYEIPLTKNLTWDCSGKGQINALVAGARGMGKSWFGMYLTIMLAKLSPSAQIFVIDFKRSDFYSLKDILPEGRVAGSKEEIFTLLEHYVDLMQKRAKFVTKYTSFGETASTLEMSPFYLVYDEWGAVTPTLDTKEKKKHDELITQICLLGRQYNFGILGLLQQASVGNSGLNSNVKEQFGLICHMGTANSTSLRQTFGESLEIPKIHLTSGQGLLFLSGMTINGNVIPFATPNLEKLDLWNEFKIAFNNQDEEFYLTFSKKKDEE